MGQVDDNVMMRRNRGMVGGQLVYRNRGGKSIVSNAPKKRTGPVTVPQLVKQKKFSKAVRYAKKLKANPVLKEMYQAGASGGQTAYNVALSDALKAPEVLDINAEAYTGTAGEVIVIEAADNFRVKEVKVVINNVLGELLEQGNAVESEDADEWLYTVTAANPTPEGSLIKVTAIDHPGNRAVLILTL